MKKSETQLTKQTKGAAKLRAWREESGYTQEKLGEFLGITKQYVWLLESGDRRPGLDLMWNLRELANIQPEEWKKDE